MSRSRVAARARTSRFLHHTYGRLNTGGTAHGLRFFTGMMRITEIEGDDRVARLRVEGDLTQRTVGELSASSASYLDGQRTLLLDVSGVRFVDPAGVEVLRDMEPRGAVLIGCSGFLRELLRSDALDDGVGVEMDDDEAALVAALRRGEDAAFEQLVRAYGGRMLATARRISNSEDDAWDAVQEAYLSAFKAVDRFSGKAKLSTWLHRIVVNAALMRVRRRRRKPEECIDDLLPRFDQHGGWASGVPAGDLPVDLLQRRETRRSVRACIERLPEIYRTVLLLRDIEELDTDEVADLLHITPNAVKIRLHRARQALRTLLEQEVIKPAASTVH